jgi:hypothetical protein
MNRMCTAPAWARFKERLKERFPHVTEGDLAAVESEERNVLQQLQRVASCSCTELAQLADEVTEVRQSRDWSPGARAKLTD